MNIFYISQCGFPSRAAQSVCDMCLCEAFANRGYDTTLIVKNKLWERAPNGYRGDIWDFYGVKHNFKVLRLFGLPRFTSWFQHKAMRQVEGNDSLIFTQSITLAALALDLQFRVILDIHSARGSRDEKILNQYAKSPKLLVVAVLTEALRQYCAEKIPSIVDKVVVAPDAVRYLAYATARASEELKECTSKTGLVAGYVGSFYPGKGVGTVVELAKLCPDVSFKIYGGTKAKLRSNFGVSELPANLEVCGFVPQSQVPQYMASLDVALLPNQEQVILPEGGDIGKWTSPMKMFEYMASKCAIIASDLPVLREVLENDRNALLVSPTDYDAWCDAIKLLQKDPALRKRLAEEAQKDAQEKYSWKTRVERIFRELDIEAKLLK